MPLYLCIEKQDNKCIFEGLSERTHYLEALKAILQTIPIGKVTTYKAIAKTLGIHPRYAARLLMLNDEPITIPCHRVVRSNGEIGGYSGPGGVAFKRKLLELEGVQFCSNGRVCKESILEELPLRDGNGLFQT